MLAHFPIVACRSHQAKERPTAVENCAQNKDWGLKTGKRRTHQDSALCFCFCFCTLNRSSWIDCRYFWELCCTAVKNAFLPLRLLLSSLDFIVPPRRHRCHIHSSERSLLLNRRNVMMAVLYLGTGIEGSGGGGERCGYITLLLLAETAINCSNALSPFIRYADGSSPLLQTSQTFIQVATMQLGS